MKNDRIIQDNARNIAVMNERMTGIQNDIADIKDSIKGLVKKIDDTYVTKDEFSPVRAIVYGLVTLVLTTVLGAIVYMVIK